MPNETPVERPADEYAKLKSELLLAHKELARLFEKRKDPEFNEVIQKLGQDILRLCKRIDWLSKKNDGYIAYGAKRDQELRAIQKEFGAMRAELDKFSQPPLVYGTVETVHEDETVTVIRNSGERLRVRVSDNKNDPKAGYSLSRGQLVLLNMEAFVIVGREDAKCVGRVGTVTEILPDGRLMLVTNMDETYIVRIGGLARDEKFALGDKVLFDVNAELALEKVAKSEERELYLEEVPNITYYDIGGLATQLEKLQKAVEWPLVHKLLFKRYKKEIPKGVLLYGPPGCGKTLIAKAVARSLADRMNKESGKSIKGYFLNVKGPELLIKWVGESERKIREMFQTAKAKAAEGDLVVIFIDEAESVLATRGTGISSDMEKTIVAQFLTLLDGLEEMRNVLVILASNRQDLIDPAILRPGRIDVKIKIDRPDRVGTQEIFSKYIVSDLPIHPKYTDEQHKKFDGKYKELSGDPNKIIKYMIERVTARLWATKDEPYTYRVNEVETLADNSMVEITTTKGEKITLYLKDLASGAMIKSIVDRAKQNAIERELLGDPDKGLMTADFCRAVEQEMQENEELPNTTDDAQKWLEMQGRHEKVVNMESFIAQRRMNAGETKKVETVTTGHYL